MSEKEKFDIPAEHKKVLSVKFKSKCGDKSAAQIDFMVDVEFDDFYQMRKKAIERVVWSAQQKLRKEPKHLPIGKKVLINSEGDQKKTFLDVLDAMKPDEQFSIMQEMLKRMNVNFPEPLEAKLERKVYSEEELGDFSKKELLTILGWYDENDNSGMNRAKLIEAILFAQELEENGDEPLIEETDDTPENSEEIE